MRIFDNNNNVSESILKRRIRRLDATSVVETYAADNGISYVKVGSTLSDSAINAAINPHSTTAEIASETRKTNAIIEAGLAAEFKSITAAQAVAYIDNNVTTLATAKTVLKIMARLIVAMRDELWPDLQDNYDLLKDIK